MNNRVVLQIPVDKKLRDEASRAVREEGFSSLQEAVRVVIAKLAKGEIRVNIDDIQLSAKARQRYDKMTEDFKLNRNVYTYNNVEEMLAKLHYVSNQGTPKIRKNIKKKSTAGHTARPKVGGEAQVIPARS